MERGNGDEVGFVIFGDCQESMTDLFDVNCTRERGLLGVVAFQLCEAGKISQEGPHDGNDEVP